MPECTSSLTNLVRIVVSSKTCGSSWSNPLRCPRVPLSWQWTMRELDIKKAQEERERERESKKTRHWWSFFYWMNGTLDFASQSKSTAAKYDFRIWSEMKTSDFKVVVLLLHDKTPFVNVITESFWLYQRNLAMHWLIQVATGQGQMLVLFTLFPRTMHWTIPPKANSKGFPFENYQDTLN